MTLSDDQAGRYARHILLEEVGAGGQERLLASSVAIPGDGPAAEEAAIYLAAGGVGRLVLSPTLAERLRGLLAGLNPDTRVATDGDAVWTFDALDPDTRRTGAQAALTALVALSGAGDPPAWDDHTEIRWHGS
ncbi:MAG: hypothetical protein ACQEXJ_22490 [Myxococcota bacterium]